MQKQSSDGVPQSSCLIKYQKIIAILLTNNYPAGCANTFIIITFFSKSLFFLPFQVFVIIRNAAVVVLMFSMYSSLIKLALQAYPYLDQEWQCYVANAIYIFVDNVE